MSENHHLLNPIAHDPNPEPPSADAAFSVHRPGHTPKSIHPSDLNELAQIEMPDCYIVSTGHGTSGPFCFQGVTLKVFLSAHLPAGATFTQIQVMSGDGFGTLLPADEILNNINRPILLATGRDGKPLTRSQGLVRLIVPTETDDALRQVKWISTLTILP